jgi:WD40 repeat protein
VVVECAAPKDTSNIIWSEPFRLIVKAPEKMTSTRLTGCLLGLAHFGLCAIPDLRAEKDYFRDVYPFLKGNCIACHNKTTTKAGLNMETPALLRKGGESGPAVIAGKSAESLIVRSAQHLEDEIMPPKNNKSGAVDLTAAQIDVLKAWIDEGAKDSVQQARTVEFRELPKGVNPIYSVALLDDAQTAVCSRANELHLYDLATRSFIGSVGDGRQPAHRSSIQSVACSPDGKWMASAAFREVKLWKRQSVPEIRWRPDAAAGLVAHTGLQGMRELLGVNAGGDLILLEAGTGKEKRRWAGIAAGAKGLEVSPDGSCVWIAWESGKAGVWSLQDSAWVGGAESLSGGISRWSGDGQWLAVAGPDKMVRVWKRPASGSTEWSKGAEWGAVAAVLDLQWEAAGARVLGCGEDGKVRLWNAKEGKLVREFAIPGAVSVAFSGDGKLLVAGSADGVTRVLETDTGKAVVEFRADVDSAKRTEQLELELGKQGLDVAFFTKEVARVEAENKALDELLKKANQAIAAVEKSLPDKQKAVAPVREKREAAQKELEKVEALVKEAPNGMPDAALKKQEKDAHDKVAAALTAENAAVFAVTAAEHQASDAKAEMKRIEGSRAANDKGLAEMNAKLKEAKEAQAKASERLAVVKKSPLEKPYKALSVGFSPEGKKVAALGSDGFVREWALSTGFSTLRAVASEAPLSAGRLEYRPDGRLVVVGSGGRFFEAGSAGGWALARTLGGAKGDVFSDRVNTVRFSPDGQWLAAGGGEPSRAGDISLWEVSTGRLVQNWKERHSDAVLCLDFSADGRWLASGGSDKLAKVTEVASGKPVFLLEGHTHHVLGVAFRRDGRVLATAGGDGFVLTWEMNHGERLKKIVGWSKEVTSIQYIGNTAELLTASGDNQIRIVTDEGAEKRAIAKLPEFMQTAVSATTATQVVGGGEDSTLRVWDGSSGKELASFEKR